MMPINKTGAAHAGLVEWLMQRLTAVYMGLFLIYLFIQLGLGVASDFGHWSNWFVGSIARWAWIIFYVSALWHAWIGLRSVFLDYVKPFTVRLLFTIIIAIAFIVHGLWVIDIIYATGGSA